MENFSKLICSNRIRCFNDPLDKNSILKSMTELFNNCDAVHKKDSILPDIITREKIISTGIGAGIAIPHIHKDYIDGINVAFGILKHGVDFNSMDKVPVHFVIMILTSGQEHERYLHVIAKFANLLRKSDIKQRLLECNDVEDVINILNIENDN